MFCSKTTVHRPPGDFMNESEIRCLTDISIDWNGLPVADVYPNRIPDLFGAKPVVFRTLRKSGERHDQTERQGRRSTL